MKRQNDALDRLQEKSGMLRQEVGEEDIAEVVSEWTGVPLTKLMEADSEKLTKMEERLKTKIIGQDQAIGVIANCVRRSRLGLADEARPMGSFIFMGPTGVGKTKLAKALAWFLFDDEEALIRIDMSEYMEKFSVSRLVGAPPGYVGYEESGQLTEKIRRRPYAVILFDEIEKAHPDVFNILLQVLDAGRLTDGQGRVVDFKNTVIIMTSNLGQDIIHATAEIGFKREEKEKAGNNVKERLLNEVRRTFRPEFLNRLDDIIIFNPLSREDVKKIIELELEPLYKKLAQQGIKLEVIRKAKDFLCEKGFDAEFGARPLKRTIQKYVQEPLAFKILSDSIKSGDKITVDLGADRTLVFSED